KPFKPTRECVSLAVRAYLAKGKGIRVVRPDKSFERSYVGLSTVGVDAFEMGDGLPLFGG
ncbi:hypothetical protein KAT92_05220, partial [Candidatus Babeliales bacterium]|nr:hypothetical protein [Candidatus Babeliales bacterium]